MNTQTNLNEIIFFSFIDNKKYSLKTNATKKIVEDYIVLYDSLKDIKAQLLFQGYVVQTNEIEE